MADIRVAIDLKELAYDIGTSGLTYDQIVEFFAWVDEVVADSVFTEHVMKVFRTL